MFLSVVIPAYNEAENVQLTIEEIKKKIEQEPAISNYEIIVIDDHSSDSTYDSVVKIGSSRVSCYRLSRRSGSHIALRAGLNFSVGDAVLCISADGQDTPDVIGNMAKKILDKKDTVWALRNHREESILARIYTMIFYKLLTNLTDRSIQKIDLERADFFMLNRKVVDSINSCKETNSSLFGLIIWLGFKQDFVEYERRPRRKGGSKWNFKSKMKLAKDWIIAFSGVPLKLITYFGFIIALIGFLYAVVIIILALNGYIKPGWAETLIIVLIIGGIQMIMLGIVGEYIWRNMDEARKRPLYFIEEENKN